MIGEQEFRDLMAGVCAPVTVVTGALDGVPYGATVSAFAALSLRPPMVMVALDARSSLLTRIVATGRFGVNVLGHAQAGVATAFARRGADRFAGADWDYDHGLPRLARSPGWLVCEVARAVEGGDHLLLLGTVIHAGTGTAAPLVYAHRTFGTHSALARHPRHSIADHVRACAR
ncbi:flavin reductase family protein [Streptomyces sp. NBC_01803]|uniref:flavin reductase family protein n=1 Tax=Streptomyces sp. NBC_01803 TaxID=2975946 RepID=UPI002DD8EC2D|nr:flavin reductase family protein [Streptomyces sp. NBC_01803]